MSFFTTFLFREIILVLLNMIEEFTILPMQKRQIREVVESSKKFSNTSDFLKSAIEILIAWESKHPEDCLQIINSLRPWTTEQEVQISQSMKNEEIKKHFGTLNIESEKDESVEQIALAQTDYDHMKVQGNYLNTMKYIKSLKISKPENIIPYDGYPMLTTSYNRFLPIKLSVLMLAHMLESKKDSKIELKNIRVNGYDLLEEYGEMIRKYEKIKGVTRQYKISTGLPKKINSGDKDKDIEMKIRIKDIQIGRTRISRKLGGNHFDGALSALGLVYAFEQDDKVFVSLSELGREFVLKENPIFPENDFSKGALSEKESEFILKEIIPKRSLENQIVKKILLTVKEQGPKLSIAESKKNLKELEANIHCEIIEYIKKNPVECARFNISELKGDNTKIRGRIKQKRLAIMGRLVELGKIKWIINEESISEYYLN